MMRQKRIDADKALHQRVAQFEGVTHLSSAALRTADVSDPGFTAMFRGHTNNITVTRTPYDSLYYAECYDGKFYGLKRFDAARMTSEKMALAITNYLRRHLK